MQPGMNVTLYLDESKTKDYLIVAAAVITTDAATIRKALNEMRMKGQRRIHFVHESDSRRRELLSAMIELRVRTHVYKVTGLNDVQARARCLEAIVEDLPGLGASRLVLERDDSIVQADRRHLRAALDARGLREQISYDHERAQAEPLLWPADAVAWSYGRGGDWRRRASGLIVQVRDLSR